jgi:pathogenesis-related protein 1
MASHLVRSFLTVLLLLALASLRVSAAADDGSNNGADLDAARRARAKATVDEILAVHNGARQAVGVPPLTWSAQIAAYAKSFAQSRRADCAPRRSPLFYFGENIFVGKGKHWNGTALTAAWVEEGSWYDHDSNSCAAAPPGAGCARYTQVVWRDTHQVGCARIVCDSGDSLLVCDYFPPGNYGTGRPY